MAFPLKYAPLDYFLLPCLQPVTRPELTGMCTFMDLKQSGAMEQLGTLRTLEAFPARRLTCVHTQVFTQIIPSCVHFPANITGVSYNNDQHGRKTFAILTVLTGWWVS